MYSKTGTDITAVYKYNKTFTAIASQADGTHVVTAANNAKKIYDSFRAGGLFLAGAKAVGDAHCNAKDADKEDLPATDLATQLIPTSESSAYTATLPPPTTSPFTGVATLTTDVIGSASPYTATVSLGFSIAMAAALADSAEIEAFSCVNNSTT